MRLLRTGCAPAAAGFALLLGLVLTLTGCDPEPYQTSQPCGSWYSPCHYVNDSSTSSRRTPLAPRPAPYKAPAPKVASRK